MSRQSATTVLLEYTQDKIAVVDDEGTFTYVNEAARQILGFRPATLCGTTAWK